MGGKHFDGTGKELAGDIWKMTELLAGCDGFEIFRRRLFYGCRIHGTTEVRWSIFMGEITVIECGEVAQKVRTYELTQRRLNGLRGFWRRKNPGWERGHSDLYFSLRHRPWVRKYDRCF